MINILVAEDDIKLNKLIRAVLENCGYRADMALDGQSAYDMFCEKHYDELNEQFFSKDVLFSAGYVLYSVKF